MDKKINPQDILDQEKQAYEELKQNGNNDQPSLEESLSAKEALGLQIRDWCFKWPFLSITIVALFLSGGIVISYKIASTIIGSPDTQIEEVVSEIEEEQEEIEVIEETETEVFPEIADEVKDSSSYLSLEAIELGKKLSQGDQFVEYFPTIAWFHDIGTKEHDNVFQSEVLTISNLNELLNADLRSKLKLLDIEQRKEMLVIYQDALQAEYSLASRQLQTIEDLRSTALSKLSRLGKSYDQKQRLLQQDIISDPQKLQEIISKLNRETKTYALYEARYETLLTIESKLREYTLLANKRLEAIELNKEALIHDITITEVELSGLNFSNKPVNYKSSRTPWGKYTPIRYARPTNNESETIKNTESPLGTVDIPKANYMAQPVTFGLY